MATENQLHPFWTDGEVMEAMHSLRRVLGEWEQVGAAEGADLDDMFEVERRFAQAMSEFELAMEVFHERQQKTG